MFIVDIPGSHDTCIHFKGYKFYYHPWWDVLDTTLYKDFLVGWGMSVVWPPPIKQNKWNIVKRGVKQKKTLSKIQQYKKRQKNEWGQTEQLVLTATG